jgi:hypothetical protein
MVTFTLPSGGKILIRVVAILPLFYFVILPKDVIERYYGKRALNCFSLNKELATMVTLLIYREDALMSQALKVFIQEHTGKKS